MRPTKKELEEENNTIRRLYSQESLNNLKLIEQLNKQRQHIRLMLVACLLTIIAILVASFINTLTDNEEVLMSDCTVWNEDVPTQCLDPNSRWFGCDKATNTCYEHTKVVT